MPEGGTKMGNKRKKSTKSGTHEQKNKKQTRVGKCNKDAKSKRKDTKMKEIIENKQNVNDYIPYLFLYTTLGKLAEISTKGLSIITISSSFKGEQHNFEI